MVLTTRQQYLIAVIILCIAYIVYWWYQSHYGPGGKYRYGITELTWKNSATAGVGDLVLALDRPPANAVKGGRVFTVSSGIVVTPSKSLPKTEAAAVERLFGGVVGLTVDQVDSGANTITFSSISAPAGWPSAFANWTANTAASGKPSAQIKISLT